MPGNPRRTFPHDEVVDPLPGIGAPGGGGEADIGLAFGKVLGDVVEDDVLFEELPTPLGQVGPASAHAHAHDPGIEDDRHVDEVIGIEGLLSRMRVDVRRAVDRRARDEIRRVSDRRGGGEVRGGLVLDDLDVAG